MGERIAITGLGICSPIGRGTAVHSQVLPAFDADLNRSRFSEQGFTDACALAADATQQALEQSGLWKEKTWTTVDPERVGCTVSASKPLFENNTVYAPEDVQHYLSHHFQWRGESRNVVAACATGAYAVALAASWIEHGLCDVVVAGSMEPWPHPLIRAGFSQMGVLSAEGFARPFDRNRSGFGLSGGAGVVVLESLSHLYSRRGVPLAYLSGWGLGSDGHSAVEFNSGGQRIAEVVQRTLSRANLSPHEVKHVNAHGTGTRVNDRIEDQALQKAFGVYAQDLMISATKSSTGHLLGAAGSVELVLTVLALQRQFVPGTVTLQNPDPECLLHYTPGPGHAARFDHALSLSFGFGGPIGALLVSRTL